MCVDGFRVVLLDGGGLERAVEVGGQYVSFAGVVSKSLVVRCDSFLLQIWAGTCQTHGGQNRCE